MLTIGQMKEMVRDYLEAKEKYEQIHRDVLALKATENRLKNEMMDKKRALNSFWTNPKAATQRLVVGLDSTTVAIVEKPHQFEGPNVTTELLLD